MQSLSRRISRGLPVGHVGRIFTGLSLLSVVASQPIAGQSFTVKDLGTLPHGSFSVARGINNQGQIVGGSETSGLSHPHAFLFEHQVMADLGLLPGASFSAATGINKRGQIAGYSGATALF